MTTSRPRALPCLHRVVGDCGRVGAAGAADEVGPGPLGPDLELLLGGRTERVRGADEHRPAVAVELARQLADRRRLAGPVHADDEHDSGLVREVERGRLAEQCLDLLGERLLQAVEVAARLEPADELDRRGHANVGGEQRLLEALPRLVVGRIELGRDELLLQRPPALPERIAEAGEEAGALLRVDLGLRLVAQQLRPRPRHREDVSGDPTRRVTPAPPGHALPRASGAAEPGSARLEAPPTGKREVAATRPARPRPRPS